MGSDLPCNKILILINILNSVDYTKVDTCII